MTYDHVRLSAYVDGELSASELREVEHHLSADRQAREVVRAYRDLSALLRTACAPAFYADTSPDQLRLSATHETSAPARRRWVAALAAAILLPVLAFSAGIFIGRTQPMSELAELVEEVSSYHLVYARETDHLVEVPATRSSELSSWLAERLGRKLTIPDLSESGLRFAGGRMLVVNGRPVAQLLYSGAGEVPVGVCLTRSDGRDFGLRIEHRRGLNLSVWNEGGFTYLVVGAMSEERGRKLADSVAEAFRG